jgi:hypothetical protein
VNGVTTVVNWPLVWIALGVFIGTFAALWALYPHRPSERPRSDSEQ